MSFQSSFGFNLPTAALRLIDQQTGQPTNFFWQFLLSQFNRTGGANGIIPIVNSAKTPQTPLIAQGNSQSTALMLAADWNNVATVPGGSGVVMPPLKPGNDISVWNSSGNALLVYPPSGMAIGNRAVNAPYSLAAGMLGYWQCWSTTQLLTILNGINPLL